MIKLIISKNNKPILYWFIDLKNYFNHLIKKHKLQLVLFEVKPLQNQDQYQDRLSTCHDR